MKRYEVTCITIYEEDANSADEAKAIIERNCPDQYSYMIAKRIESLRQPTGQERPR